MKAPHRINAKAALFQSTELLDVVSFNNGWPCTYLTARKVPNNIPIKGSNMKMRFKFNGVPIAKWEDKKDRLGRFFSKDLNANLTSETSGEIELTLLPKENLSENSSQAFIQ